MTGQIFIFSRALPMHGMGGMELIAWDLARELAGLGAGVTVVTTTIPGLPASFRQGGVDVFTLPGTTPGRYSPAWWSTSRRFLGARRPADVGAVLSVSAAGFGLLGLKPRFPAARFVLQAHGTSWDEIRSKWRGGGMRGRLSSLRNIFWLPKDLIAYRRFDLVVAVGDAVAASLARPPISLVLPRSKRRLIQNGIDTALFAPDAAARRDTRARHAVPAAARVIISASRLHPQKGGAQGLRAFAAYSAKTPDARYWIAGDGPELERLRGLARQLGIAGQVIFLGGLARPALAQYLQAADAFLFLGNRIEVGLPLNVLEALAAGLPVVLSQHLAPAPLPGLFPVSADDAQGAAGQLIRAAVAGAPRRAMLPAAFHLRRCAQSYLDLLLPKGL